MLFLIHYDRSQGKIVSLREFPDGDRNRASDERLVLELELGPTLTTQEVVIMEADSEEALRRTHRRFFEDVAALMQTPAHGSQVIDD
jgi:hypothetical protein